MLSRRWFAGCALCAGTVLVATDPAQAQASGLTRQVLSQVDTGPNQAVMQVMVDIQPGFLVARHTHPGIESSVVLSGSGTLVVAGQADRMLQAGDPFQVPREVPHALQNGGAAMRVLAVYTVDKDKPLASPAPA